MATFGIAFSTCCLLAKKYPDGYTLEELYNELSGTTKIFNLGEEWLARSILGIEDGKPHCLALVACWKMQEDGMICFDPYAKRYSNYDDVNFKGVFEKWLISQKLEKRRLNRGD